MELWKSDGTGAGTQRVRDINPGAFGAFSSRIYIARVGGTLYFVANDRVSGEELWKSDGTEAGTVRVKDIRPGNLGGLSWHGAPIANIGDTLYFVGHEPSGGQE